MYAVPPFIDQDRDSGVRRAEPGFLAKNCAKIELHEIMSPVLHSPFRTTFSSSAKVRALLVALANSAISGWPTADLSDPRISWKGLDDTTLNRSIFEIQLLHSFSHDRATSSSK